MPKNLKKFRNSKKSPMNTMVVFGLSAATLLIMGLVVVFIILAGKPGARADVSTSLLVCKGDVNRDGTVTSSDVQLVFNAFKHKSTDSTYDINGDGGVSNEDVKLTKSFVGQKCSYRLYAIYAASDGVALGFSPTSVGGINLIIKNTSGGTVATLGPIEAGQISVPWYPTAENLGKTYSAVLVFTSTQGLASNQITFSVPPAPSPTPAPVNYQWVVSQTIINGGVVTIYIDPASNGNINVIVKNTANNSTVYDSGPIASGATQVVWNNATAGSYSAQLFYGTAPVSGMVTFSVQ